jgi:Tfp pilus assembly major pilin PilA
MSVVAIIGILAAIAIPSYQQYTKKAKFSEVIQATQPFKASVEVCINDIGFANVANCQNGSNGVQADVTGNPSTYVNKITTLAGVVDVVPNAPFAATEDYQLTPTMPVANGSG